jgi:hypothetical protein
LISSTLVAWRPPWTRIGGPNFIAVPGDGYIAAVRLHDGKVRTALCRLDVKRARLEEIATLPSSGDSSYAGLAMHDGTLHVSYYSSHEERTSIYLARVRL